MPDWTETVAGWTPVSLAQLLSWRVPYHQSVFGRREAAEEEPQQQREEAERALQHPHTQCCSGPKRGGWVLGAMTLLRFLLFIVKLLALAYFCLWAYRIRLKAIEEYGYIIHEFDPWFHYRATVYLAEQGWYKFFHWYDYMSWYPIGRPVGTTIYPGMQIISVAIWRTLAVVRERLHFEPISLNEVCCLVPAWFGALATFLLFLLTAEVSESTTAGVAAAAIMAAIPAHVMRSMAGGFDNEAVAVSTFIAVLWLWCRSVRTPRSWPVAVLAGLAYTVAAASWGGYIFVNNMVALHAGYLVSMGKFNTGLYMSYTIYWVIGTFGATRVPCIGWAPLRSPEQMPSLLMFIGYQIILFCVMYRRTRGQQWSARKYCRFLVGVFSACGLAGAAAASVLSAMGVFMPLGLRIRGLFMEAEKTGNPLVDSVARHSPSNDQVFDVFLGKARYLAVVGLLFCWHQSTPGKFLPFLYAAVAYHFSLKMSRLMTICSPIVSMLAGFPVGILSDWCLEHFLGLLLQPVGVRSFLCLVPVAMAMQMGISVGAPAIDFVKHCNMFAKHVSNPQLLFKSRLQDGSEVIVDDYWKSYQWIKENTPQDARVMALWDYGYQITGIAERTSIADGNTWNHEHIALVGWILTSTEEKSHDAMRHLADYVLVLAGGHDGDDVAKAPHMARIGSAAFPESLTPMLAESFLYKAVNHNVKEGVSLNTKFWKEVHTTRYGLMRIYKVLNTSQASKDWVADPANRLCDVPGSWHCRGQYPPELAPLIALRRNL